MAAENKTTVVITAEDRTAKAFGAVTANLGKLTSAFGVGLSVAGFTSVIKGSINAADELNKMAQKVGVSVESLSALQYAGKLSDVSLESLGTALKKLSVNMLDAAAGSGDAKDAFKALGINVKDGAGNLKSSDVVLAELADKFRGMEDGAGKTALAVKILGRAGSDLIPMLNGGSRGLAEMKDEAQKLGVIVGGDLAKKSEQFNDNLTRLNATLGATKIALAGGLIDQLNNLSAAMVESTKAAGGLWKGLMLLDGADADNPVAGLERIEKKLESLRTMKAEIESSSANKSAFRDLPFLGTDGDLKVLEKQIAFAEKQRAALAALAKSRGAFDFGPPVDERKGKAPGLATGKTRAAGSVEDYAMRINQAVAGAISGSAVVKAAELGDQIERLDSLFFDSGLDAGIYSSALDKLTGRTVSASDQTERLNQLIAATPSAQLEKARNDMLLLAAAFEKGTKNGGISEEQFIEAAQAISGYTGKALDEMTEFVREAARNMQDALADGLFDIMQGRFDNIGRSFKTMLDRMVANATAANLSSYMLGDFGKTGVLGGVAGDAASEFGDWLRGAMAPGFGDTAGVLAGVPRFAEGTAYVPRTGLALIHQGERIIPAAENRAGAGMANVFNFTINGPVDRRSQQQIAAAAGDAVERAMRRNR